MYGRKWGAGVGSRSGRKQLKDLPENRKMWNGTNGFHHPIMKIIFTNSCLMTTFIQLQNCNA